MARSRNIKPGLFKNEDLAECSIWARYLFPGLWCIADREGRLEDRPKRIKGELLAFDNVDVEPLLGELETHGFIARYEVAGHKVIQILNFAKHQNPHFREQASALPCMPGWDSTSQPGEKPEAQGTFKDTKAPGMPEAQPLLQTASAPGMPGAGPRLSTHESDLERGASPADSLFSDSLIPDSLSPQPPKGGRTRRSYKADEACPGFAQWWAEWPASARKGAKGKCQEAWLRHGCEAIAEEIIAHVVHKRDKTAWAKDRGEYVEAPLVYLNQRKWEGAEIAGAGSSGPAAMGFEIGSDDYLQANSKAAWWREAGFANVWEAADARCWHTNAHKFRDGKLIQATQEEPA